MIITAVVFLVVVLVLMVVARALCCHFGDCDERDSESWDNAFFGWESEK